MVGRKGLCGSAVIECGCAVFLLWLEGIQNVEASVT